MNLMKSFLRKTAKQLLLLGTVLALTACPWMTGGFAAGLPTGTIAGAGADYSGAAEGRDFGPLRLSVGTIAGAGADYSGAAESRDSDPARLPAGAIAGAGAEYSGAVSNR